MYLTWKLLLAGEMLLLCHSCIDHEADVAVHQDIIMHNASFLINSFAYVCCPCSALETMCECVSVCVCVFCIQAAIVANKRLFSHRLWYVTGMEIINTTTVVLLLNQIFFLLQA